MMEDEQESKSQYSGKTNNMSTYSGDASTKATAKAEDMVKKMQKIISEFDQGRTIQDERKKRHEPYELNTANPNEKWMVLWAETQGREYYHEENTGKVQWDKPDVNAKPGEWTRVVDFSKQDHYVPSDFEPTGLQRSTSRRTQYRMLQKRKRNRRRIFIAMLALLSAGTSVYVYNSYKTSSTFAAKVDDVLDVVHSSLPSSIAEQFGPTKQQRNEMLTAQERAIKEAEQKEAAARAKREKEAAEKRAKEMKAEAERKQRIKDEAERKEKAEAERKQKLKAEAERKQKLKAEAERKQRERAEDERKRKEKAEAESKQRELEENERKQREQEEAERKQRELEEEALLKAREEEARKNAELAEQRIMAQKQRIAELQEELRATAKAKEARRPTHCNLPLAYIFNKRCWNLSSANPIFDLKSLTDAMMQ